MLLGYKLPRDWTYSVVDAVLLTPDVELLHDNEPGEKVRFEWDDTDPQTTSTAVAIQALRVSAFVPRAGCLLGVTLPVGLKVEIRGRRAIDAGYTYELGGNALTQRVVEFDDGTRGLLWVFDDGLDAIVGYEVKLFNDVAGSLAIEPEQIFEIGQVRVGPGVSIPHELGWSARPTDPSIFRRTLGAAVQRVHRRGFRTAKLRPAWGRVDAARGGALAGGMDWQQLLGILARDPFCLVFARWQDHADLQRVGGFGLITVLPGIEHKAGPIYQMQEMTFEEVPAG